MNDQPYCALEARHRAVHGCIAEPAFGYVLERFQFGWCRFSQRLTRFFSAQSPFLNPRHVHIVVCIEDPWPPGLLEALRSQHLVITLNKAWIQDIMRYTERILEMRLPNARPHLMAFLGQHADLRSAAKTADVATAWALQFARDQLLKAELSRHHLVDSDPWGARLPNPIGTCVRLKF